MHGKSVGSLSLASVIDMSIGRYYTTKPHIVTHQLLTRIASWARNQSHILPVSLALAEESAPVDTSLSAFMAIASLLWAFKILPEEDVDGKVLLPDVMAFTDGFVS